MSREVSPLQKRLQELNLETYRKPAGTLLKTAQRKSLIATLLDLAIGICQNGDYLMAEQILADALYGPHFKEAKHTANYWILRAEIAEERGLVREAMYFLEQAAIYQSQPYENILTAFAEFKLRNFGAPPYSTPMADTPRKLHEEKIPEDSATTTQPEPPLPKVERLHKRELLADFSESPLPIFPASCRSYQKKPKPRVRKLTCQTPQARRPSLGFSRITSQESDIIECPTPITNALENEFRKLRVGTTRENRRPRRIPIKCEQDDTDSFLDSEGDSLCLDTLSIEFPPETSDLDPDADDLFLAPVLHTPTKMEKVGSGRLKDPHSLLNQKPMRIPSDHGIETKRSREPETITPSKDFGSTVRMELIKARPGQAKKFGSSVLVSPVRRSLRLIKQETTSKQRPVLAPQSKNQPLRKMLEQANFTVVPNLSCAPLELQSEDIKPFHFRMDADFDEEDDESNIENIMT